LTHNVCPVCENNCATEFLRRNSVPVHQNLIMNSFDSAINITKGDLVLRYCRDCGFVFNGDFDENKLCYGAEYDNSQTHSPCFASYIDERIKSLLKDKNVVNSRIVEVGCGKGTFLKKLVEDSSRGNTGYGFDPSYEGDLTFCDGRLNFIRDYYGPSYSGFKADVVICRHVIEHISRPVDLLRAVRQALSDSPGARVFFETPCVEWILSNKVVWDFFYEHCSYFSKNSITAAFETAGFEVIEVKHVFGGQYMWLEARPSNAIARGKLNSGHIPALAEKYRDDETRIKKLWSDSIKKLARKAKVAIWGAGAKGVTFANMIDEKRNLFECVVDLNQRKSGHYLPGTGHPIISFREIPHYGVKYAVLMNPNYREENQKLIDESNIGIELVNLMELKNENYD